MKKKILKEIKNDINLLLDNLSYLSKSNRLTGIWDNRRFQEAKKEINLVNLEYLYKTEKLSRKNVEARGLARTNLDNYLLKILKNLKKL